MRRFLDGTPAGPTIIGAGSVFVGNLSGTGPFVVSGEVHGDGELLGDLNVSAGGAWMGNIRARRAIIAGRICGSLRILEKLEVGRSAVIRGRVSARQVAIATGAIVAGEIEVTSGEAIVQFEEKRGR